MELVTPCEKYKESFIEAVKEFQAEPATTGRHERYRELSIPKLEENFEVLLQQYRDAAEGKNLKPGFVPWSMFWLEDGGAFIGATSIRHELNDHLLREGGHVGYDVRPSMRGRGLGNKILELTIPKARELGVQKILVTCSENNIASRKVIEKNGGVLENSVPMGDGKPNMLRFWIQ